MPTPQSSLWKPKPLFGADWISAPASAANLQTEPRADYLMAGFGNQTQAPIEAPITPFFAQQNQLLNQLNAPATKITAPVTNAMPTSIPSDSVSNSSVTQAQMAEWWKRNQQILDWQNNPYKRYIPEMGTTPEGETIGGNREPRGRVPASFWKSLGYSDQDANLISNGPQNSSNPYWARAEAAHAKELRDYLNTRGATEEIQASKKAESDRVKRLVLDYTGEGWVDPELLNPLTGEWIGSYSQTKPAAHSGPPSASFWKQLGYNDEEVKRLTSGVQSFDNPFFEKAYRAHEKELWDYYHPSEPFQPLDQPETPEEIAMDATRKAWSDAGYSGYEIARLAAYGELTPTPPKERVPIPGGTTYTP